MSDCWAEASVSTRKMMGNSLNIIDLLLLIMSEYCVCYEYEHMD